MKAKQIAHYIDHTALTAEKSETDILKLCEEAIAHQFFSVCAFQRKNLYCGRISARCQFNFSKSV